MVILWSMSICSPPATSTNGEQWLLLDRWMWCAICMVSASKWVNSSIALTVHGWLWKSQLEKGMPSWNEERSKEQVDVVQNHEGFLYDSIPLWLWTTSMLFPRIDHTARYLHQLFSSWSWRPSRLSLNCNSTNAIRFVHADSVVMGSIYRNGFIGTLCDDIRSSKSKEGHNRLPRECDWEDKAGQSKEVQIQSRTGRAIWFHSTRITRGNIICS